MSTVTDMLSLERTPDATRARPRHRWVRPAAMAMLAVLLIGGALAWWAEHRASPVQYLTVAVTRGSITRNVTATGTVNPDLTIIIGSYVSGVIKSVYCDYNTHVTRGQLCAKIDPRACEAALEQSASRSNHHAGLPALGMV